MQLLFLALGASRRRAVVDESRRIVESGGRAVVLVSDVSSWSAEAFAPGVRVVPVRSAVAHRLHRAADRLHRKVYGKPLPDRRKRASAAAVQRFGSYDAFVVTDPASFPVAQGLITEYGPRAPRVVFRIDQLITPAHSQPTDHEEKV